MSRFSTYKIEDIADVQTGPFGSQLHMSDYVTNGTPIITVEHFGENKILHGDIPLVSDEDKQRLIKYTLRTGDIVFSRVGSVDRRVFVTEKENGWMFSGRCLRVRVTSSKADSMYLSYYFGLESFKEYIRANAVGATMPSINTTILSEAEVILPDLIEQRAIAEVLSSLDDKIDLLHRNNKTLEEMAEVIYKNMFHPSLSKEGSQVKLGDYIKTVSGYSYRSNDLQPSNIALVTLKSFDRNGGFRMDGFKEYTGPYKAEQVVEEGDLVVAHTDITQEAEVIGNPAIVQGHPAYTKLVISTDLVKVIPERAVTIPYLYFLMRSDDFKHYCLGASNGTTVMHLSKRALPEYEFSLPDSSDIAAFTEKCSAILDKIALNQKMIRTLETSRDTLLPKLMSGQVRVKEI